MAECPICRDDVSVLRLLKCSHSYCENCLKRIECNGQISCPMCRQSTKLSASALPKLYDVKIRCSECNEEKRIGRDLIWCHSCLVSLCGMCFLTNHNQSGHKFSKWITASGQYPAMNDCFVILKRQLAGCVENEEILLNDYFDSLRATAKSQMQAIAEKQKIPLLNVVNTLVEAFPSVSTSPLITTANGQSSTAILKRVSNALQQFAAVTGLPLDIDLTSRDAIPLSIDVGDFLGIHRHCCLPILFDRFKKPAAVYEVPDVWDFTVLHNGDIFYVTSGNGSNITINKLHSTRPFVTQFGVCNLLKLAVYKENGLFLGIHNSNNDCRAYVYDATSGLCVKTFPPNYLRGGFKFVESDSDVIFGARDIKIYENLDRMSANFYTTHIMADKLCFIVEKSDLMEFLYLEGIDEFAIKTFSRLGNLPVEHRKISFRFLLNKFNLLPQFFVGDCSCDYMMKSITNACHYSGNLQDYMFVAVQFQSTENDQCYTTVYLFDYRCSVVHKLQQFDGLDILKMLVRNNRLYCLMDLDENSKRKPEFSKQSKCLFVFSLDL